MATRPQQLYEKDFYAWTRDQAKALRRLAATRPNVDLDFPHLIEEVADLGISQRDAVRSHASDHGALPEAGIFPGARTADRLV